MAGVSTRLRANRSSSEFVIDCFLDDLLDPAFTWATIDALINYLNLLVDSAEPETFFHFHFATTMIIFSSSNKAIIKIL